MGTDTRAIARTATGRLNLQTQAVARLQALPEVASVAWADRPPFLGTGSAAFSNAQGAVLGCIFNGVSDEYFATLGIPLVAGRAFTSRKSSSRRPLPSSANPPRRGCGRGRMRWANESLLQALGSAACWGTDHSR